MSTIDQNVIENLKKLQRPGMPNLLHRVIDIFISESAEKEQLIDKAVQENNAEELAFIAHALKSSSANLGAIQFSKVCAEVEQVGKAGDITKATDLMQTFKTEYKQAQQALLDIRNQ